MAMTRNEKAIHQLGMDVLQGLVDHRLRLDPGEKALGPDLLFIYDLNQQVGDIRKFEEQRNKKPGH